MKPSTSRCEDVGGVSARWAGVPLKNRYTVLMMHEIAVGCVKPVRFGMAKSDHRRTRARGLRKRPVPARGSAPTGFVGSRKGSTCTPFYRWLLKNQHVFPLGWYLHVAVGTKLRLMCAYRIVPALL